MLILARRVGESVLLTHPDGIEIKLKITNIDSDEYCINFNLYKNDRLETQEKLRIRKQFYLSKYDYITIKDISPTIVRVMFFVDPKIKISRSPD